MQDCCSDGCEPRHTVGSPFVSCSLNYGAYGNHMQSEILVGFVLAAGYNYSIWQTSLWVLDKLYAKMVFCKQYCDWNYWKIALKRSTYQINSSQHFQPYSIIALMHTHNTVGDACLSQLHIAQCNKPMNIGKCCIQNLRRFQENT